MSSTRHLRIAWVYPSIIYGAYWSPVMREFRKHCLNFVFFTGRLWPGFDSAAPENSAFMQVGRTRYVQNKNTVNGYGRAFIYASPTVIFRVLAFRPQVVFASAFSIWTVLSLVFRAAGGWKVVVIYDGSTPNSDFKDSSFRSTLRRWIAKRTDAFIANSNAARSYIVKDLGVDESRVFSRTYLVPDATSMQRHAVPMVDGRAQGAGPVFLYVGQLIERKGLKLLFDACQRLKSSGLSRFTVLVVGDGEGRDEFRAHVQAAGLSEQVEWAGWVPYEQLGPYFERSDVFVFPTYEDVWGMVVLEAMVFGKPVLCSKGANSCEMVVPGENGHVFDAGNSEQLADGMRSFFDNPGLVSRMGQRSRELIAQHNPATAAEAFAEVAAHVVGGNGGARSREAA